MSDSIYYSQNQVATKDCSGARTIKLTNFLDYLQDAAWRNASHLGFSTLDLLKNDITWVMNRMKINFYRFPSDNEKFTIETWPSAMSKYYTTRDFRVRDAGENILLEASSNWLVMDINQRKLVSIPEFIKEANFVVDRGNVSPCAGKIVYDQTKTEQELPISVSWFDLDINDHVNNTKFYQWVLDSLDGEFLNSHRLTGIDIMFRHEGKYGDEFSSKSYFVPEEDFHYHCLINDKKGQESVLAKTRFVKI